MRLPALAPREALRARRWDVVVLGGALPGLVAAVRLSMRGGRVLVVDEREALDAPPGLREPFLLPGAHAEDVLGQCLRALGVPLIDQRRVVRDGLSLQVVLPDARIDVGDLRLTADELAAWGLAKPEAARDTLRAIAESAVAEREALLDAPIVRTPRRFGLGSRRAAPAPARLRPNPPAPPRPLPAEVEQATARLGAFFRAIERVLSGAAGSTGRAARARLLGMALEGAHLLAGEPRGVHGLLRRRIEALYGEFRAVPAGLRLFSVSQQPGVAPRDGDDLWLGRVLLVNAPRAALAGVADDPSLAPSRGSAPGLRRVTRLFRVDPEALPEAMAPRVAWVADPDAPLEGENFAALRRLPVPRDADPLLAGSAWVSGDPRNGAAGEEAAGRAIESALAQLLPLGRDAVRPEPAPAPRWDHDAWLPAPARGSADWSACDLRLSARPPIYTVERSGLSSMGFEGDLLLGWRAGDAIAAELF